MSTKSTIQKDYRPLNTYHAHLKNFKGNKSINRKKEDILNICNSNNIAIKNFRNFEKINNIESYKNSVNEISNSDTDNKFNQIQLSCIIKKQKQQQEQEKDTILKNKKNVMIINSNCNYKNNYHRYHHHHHYHHYNINKNNSNNQNHNIINNIALKDTITTITTTTPTTTSINMRKSFIGSDANNTSFSSAIQIDRYGNS